MSKTILILILAGMFILNMIVIYENDNWAKNYQILKKECVEKGDSSRWLESDNHNHNNLNPEYPKLISNNIRLSQDSLKIVVFFTDKGCSICVENEVAILNSFIKKYPNYVDVYLMSYSHSYLKRLYKAEFSYSVLDPRDQIFSERINIENPIAFLVDKNAQIQMLHLAEIDNREKSVEFYTRIGSLLDSI